MSTPVHVKTNPSLNDTVKLIFTQLLWKSHQVADLVKTFHLYDPDPIRCAEKIHAFTREWVRYKLDPKQWELVRSAAQTWKDRDEGVDCEDLTIFETSLMIQCGHGEHVWLTIVDIANESTGPEHIYPVVVTYRATQAARPTRIMNHKPIGIAFDACLPRFNQHPEGIVMALQLMALGNPYPGQNLGAVPKPASAGMEGANRRKAQWIEQANPEDRKAIASIMHLVRDVNADGTIVWNRGVSQSEVAAILEGQGLGAPGRKNRPRPNERRNAGQTIARIFPALIIGRNAFLLLVRLNAFKFASHLRIIFMDPEVAKKSKKPELYAKAIAQRPKVEKAWKNFGGDLESLKKAIAAGAKIQASRLNGLGDPTGGAATGTALITAAPILAVITPIIAVVPWKELGGEGDGVTDKDGNLDGKKLAEAVGAAIKKVKGNKTQAQLQSDQAIESLGTDGLQQEDTGGGSGGDGFKKPDSNESGGKGWIWALVGLGVVGVGGAVWYFNSQSNSNKNGNRK